MQWRQRCSGRECRDGSGTLARECTPKIRGWATRSQRHSRHGLWRRGGDKEGSRVVAGIIARGAHTATAGCDGCVTAQCPNLETRVFASCVGGETANGGSLGSVCGRGPWRSFENDPYTHMHALETVCVCPVHTTYGQNRVVCWRIAVGLL